MSTIHVIRVQFDPLVPLSQNKATVQNVLDDIAQIENYILTFNLHYQSFSQKVMTDMNALYDRVDAMFDVIFKTHKLRELKYKCDTIAIATTSVVDFIGQLQYNIAKLKKILGQIILYMQEYYENTTFPKKTRSQSFISQFINEATQINDTIISKMNVIDTISLKMSQNVIFFPPSINIDINEATLEVDNIESPRKIHIDTKPTIQVRPEYNTRSVELKQETDIIGELKQYILESNKKLEKSITNALKDENLKILIQQISNTLKTLTNVDITDETIINKLKMLYQFTQSPNTAPIDSIVQLVTELHEYISHTVQSDELTKQILQIYNNVQSYLQNPTSTLKSLIEQELQQTKTMYLEQSENVKSEILKSISNTEQIDKLESIDSKINAIDQRLTQTEEYFTTSLGLISTDSIRSLIKMILFEMQSEIIKMPKEFEAQITLIQSSVDKINSQLNSHNNKFNEIYQLIAPLEINLKQSITTELTQLLKTSTTAKVEIIKINDAFKAFEKRIEQTLADNSLNQQDFKTALINANEKYKDVFDQIIADHNATLSNFGTIENQSEDTIRALSAQVARFDKLLSDLIKYATPTANLDDSIAGSMSDLTSAVRTKNKPMHVSSIRPKTQQKRRTDVADTSIPTKVRPS
jgi:hypothetical protein